MGSKHVSQRNIFETFFLPNIIICDIKLTNKHIETNASSPQGGGGGGDSLITARGREEGKGMVFRFPCLEWGIYFIAFCLNGISIKYISLQMC